MAEYVYPYVPPATRATAPLIGYRGSLWPNVPSLGDVSVNTPGSFYQQWGPYVLDPVGNSAPFYSPNPLAQPDYPEIVQTAAHFAYGDGSIAPAALTLTAASATMAYAFYNRALVIRNASGSSVTATVGRAPYPPYTTGTNPVHTIAAGTTAWIGPLGVGGLEDPTRSDRDVPWTTLVLSATSSISVGAIHSDSQLSIVENVAAVTASVPLAIQPLSATTGLVPTMTAASASGHVLYSPSTASRWTFGGLLWLYVVNGSGVSVTVSATQRDPGLYVPYIYRRLGSATIPAGASRLVPFLAPQCEGLLVTYSATASVSVAALDPLSAFRPAGLTTP